MEYVLKPLKHLTGEEVTVSSDPTGEIIQLDPDRNVKYAFMLNVGDLPPAAARQHIENTMEKLKDFFGPGRVLVIPRRPEDTEAKIFQLEPVVE